MHMHPANFRLQLGVPGSISKLYRCMLCYAMELSNEWNKLLAIYTLQHLAGAAAVAFHLN